MTLFFRGVLTVFWRNLVHRDGITDQISPLATPYVEYIEKELPGKLTEEPMDFSQMEKMAKLPSFLIKFLLKKNIK
ncbi:unnamed protein product, partial [marine sediment metagenome]